MRVAAKGLGDDLFELCLHLVHGLARSESGPVADAEDVRIDRERFLPECSVEHDIRGLAADAGEGLTRLPRAWDYAAMVGDEIAAERDHVLCLGVKQADRLDRFAQRVFAEVDHLLRCLDAREQGTGRDVDARVRGLGGKHDRDQQLVRIARLQLGRGRRVRFREPTEKLENLLSLHSEPMTSCIE